MLTVDALPAACIPLNISSIGKFGVRLSTILDIMYTEKE
jgi:hypothetical protein